MPVSLGGPMNCMRNVVVLGKMCWIGYVPNEVQSEETRQGMLFLMGGLPLIGYGIGIALFSRFDLKKAEHARIRTEIDGRS